MKKEMEMKKRGKIKEMNGQLLDQKGERKKKENQSKLGEKRKENTRDEREKMKKTDKLKEKK